MTASSPSKNVESWHSLVGIILAILSGFFIGTSLVLQKKALINSNSGTASSSANEFIYLKSKLWWVGFSFMIIGELCNFGAYAFSPAIIVTPLGAVSVIVSAILSIFVLNGIFIYFFLTGRGIDKLNFSGSMGIVLCIIGSIQIVLHAPASTQTETIPEFFSYVLAPGFLVYLAMALIFMLYMTIRMGPLHGDSQPIVYLSITALGGAFLANAAQGLGSSIVYSLDHPSDSQFRLWPMYPLICFVILCAVFQVVYLNRALANFTTSIVTPTNYVFFSTLTLVTSAVLFRGFGTVSTIEGVKLVLGFIIIVIGVSLLFQYNLKLQKLERLQRQSVNFGLESGGSGVKTENNFGLGGGSMSISVSASEQGAGETVHDPFDLNPVALWIESFPVKGKQQSVTLGRVDKVHRASVIQMAEKRSSTLPVVGSESQNENPDEVSGEGLAVLMAPRLTSEPVSSSSL